MKKYVVALNWERKDCTIKLGIEYVTDLENKDKENDVMLKQRITLLALQARTPRIKIYDGCTLTNSSIRELE